MTGLLPQWTNSEQLAWWWAVVPRPDQVVLRPLLGHHNCLNCLSFTETTGQVHHTGGKHIEKVPTHDNLEVASPLTDFLLLNKKPPEINSYRRSFCLHHLSLPLSAVLFLNIHTSVLQIKIPKRVSQKIQEVVSC